MNGLDKEIAELKTFIADLKQSGFIAKTIIVNRATGLVIPK